MKYAAIVFIVLTLASTVTSSPGLLDAYVSIDVKPECSDCNGTLYTVYNIDFTLNTNHIDKALSYINLTNNCYRYRSTIVYEKELFIEKELDKLVEKSETLNIDRIEGFVKYIKYNTSYERKIIFKDNNSSYISVETSLDIYRVDLINITLDIIGNSSIESDIASINMTVFILKSMFKGLKSRMLYYKVIDNGLARYYCIRYVIENLTTDDLGKLSNILNNYIGGFLPISVVTKSVELLVLINSYSIKLSYNPRNYSVEYVEEAGGAIALLLPWSTPLFIEPLGVVKRIPKYTFLTLNDELSFLTLAYLKGSAEVDRYSSLTRCKVSVELNRSISGNSTILKDLVKSINVISKRYNVSNTRLLVDVGNEAVIDINGNATGSKLFFDETNYTLLVKADITRKPSPMSTVMVVAIVSVIVVVIALTIVVKKRLFKRFSSTH